MRKIYFLLLLLVCYGSVVRAQTTAAGYSWSQTTGTYTALSGASTAISGAWDNNVVSGIGIGFTFNYMGSSYTTVSISSNGWIALGSVTLTTTTYTPISTLGGGTNGVISASGCNLQASSASDPITYLTTGSTGSRVFTVEYKNVRFSGSAVTESWNFQIKLYETSNIIQVVYGSATTPTTSRTMQVGIRGTAVTDYNNRTTTTNWSATTAGTAATNLCTRNTTVQPANGLIYSWCRTSERPSISVSPTSGCASYSASASGGSSYTWSPAASVSASTGSSVTVTGGGAITVTGYGSNGCSNTATTTAGGGFTPVTAVTSTSVCPTGTVTMGAGLTSTSVYTVSAITYDSIDMTGATAGPTGDDVSGSATIPFNFNYYGTNYTAVNICTNGFINFGTASTSLSTGAYPSTTLPSGGVAIFEGDLYVASPGSITYKTVGTAPFRKFVISYNYVGNCCTAADLYKGQIVLYETFNFIDIFVHHSASAVRTIGVQNIGGTLGLGAPGRNGVTYAVTTPEGWRFGPVSSVPTYAWTPASTLSSSTAAAPVATPTATTTYTVVVTAAGCTGSTTRTITVNSVTAAISPTNGCYGTNMTASGGTSYAWSPASGLSATTGATVMPTPTVATTYSVTVTNAAGCTGTATKTVNLLPTVSVTPTSASYCAGSPETLTASGGTSYSWSPASGLTASTGASVAASPTIATTYTVTGTDAITGCGNTATSTVNVVAVPTWVAFYDTTICYPGIGSATTDGVAGSWASTNTSVATIDPTTGVITSVGAGTTNIVYTTSCGSAYNTLTVVTGGFTMTATPSSANYCAASGAVSITISGADTVGWLPGTGLSSPYLTTVTASPSATTVYTVYGTVYGTPTCRNSINVTVTNITPAAITGGVTTLCTGVTTTWTSATPGGTWTSSDTTKATVNPSTGVITGVAAGSATITYTVGSCYVTRNITINTSPTLSFTPTTAANCGGAGVSVTASGATTYIWTPATGLSATTGATVTATPASNTTYTITGTSAAGCAATGTKFVGVSAAVTAIAAVSSPTVCSGTADTLGAGVTSTAVYTVSAVTYSVPTMTSPVTLSWTSTDDQVQAVTVPFTFNYYGTNYTSVNICTNGWINFGTAGSATNYGGYNLPSTTYPTTFIDIFHRDLNVAGATGGAISYSTEGRAPFRRFVVNFNNICDFGSTAGGNSGFIVFYETTNFIDMHITSTTNTTHICAAIQNAAGTLGIAATGRNYGTYQVTTPEGWRFAPVTPTPTYAWLPTTGLSSSTVVNPIATPTATTTYTVTISNNGCSGTATSTITVNALPTVSISSPACTGLPITASGATTYTWSPATALSATTGATVTASPTVATTYTVSGTASGCTGTTAVTVNLLPTVSVTPASGCSPQSMTASGATTYTWAPATALDATTGATVTASPSAGTTYTVTGTASTGCANTGTAFVGQAPSAIYGTTTVCALLTTNLYDSVAGGTWTSSDTTVATVNPTTGVVTGVAAGSCSIFYTVGTCSPVSTTVTVLTSPTLSISPSTGCANPTQTLVASGATTYSWSPATDLDVTTGSTVVSTPTAVRVYTLSGSNGTCAVTTTVTVNPAPATITGGVTTLCSGSNTTWSNSVAGATWSSDNTAVATVNSSGVVTGVGAGTATISYGFAGCPSTAATRTINIGGTPTLVNASAANCLLASTATPLTVTGATTYSWAPSTGLSATTGSTVNASITGATTYTVTGTGSGGCTSTITVPVYTVTSVTTPTVTASPSSTCSGGTSSLAISAPTGGYSLNSITYALASMTSPVAGPTGDDVTGAITLPFTFNFYGTNYTQVNVCTNGFINFGTTGYTTYPAAAIPNGGAPYGAVFLNWGDRWFGSPGAITYSFEGTSPNRKCVINFSQGSNCCTFTNLWNGQIILYETSNYIDMMVTNANTNSTNGTMGIQNPAATSALVVSSRNATPYNVTSTEGWRFAPDAFSYSWSPATSLTSTTAATTTLTSAPGAGTYTATTTNTSTGCVYRNNVVVSVGSMTATVTAATTSVCSGGTTTVTFNGPAGGTIYYNINGGSTLSATLSGVGVATVTTSALTSTTNYNLVSVANGSCSNSVSGTATINILCFCTPTYSSTATTYAMNRVQIPTGYGGTSLDDSYTPPTAGYINRTTAVSPISMQQGNTYATTVNYSSTYYYYQNQIWIDFNDNGTFETTESVTPVFGLGGCTTTRSFDASTITIPVTATTGTHRMRVRNANTLSCTISSAMNPCNTTDGTVTYYYGSTADYTVNIVALPACSGTPTAGTASASVTSGCATYSSTVNLPITASGQTYQWQSSTDSSSWSPISGATTYSVSASVSTVNLYYRCVTTCTASGLSATSAPAVMHSAPAITGASTVCQSGTTTLSNALGGGTWSSSATGVATVGSTSGIVSGVAAGSATISYVTTGCTQTFSITTIGIPATITGTASVCRTFTTTLANTTTGGTWSSSDSTIANVNSTGVVTGVAIGTAYITYSTGCGTPATSSYTVNTQPSAITGLASVCTTSTNTFVDSISGGTWTNSPTAVGTIASGTGIFTSTTTTGTTVLTYTIGSCTTTYSLAVGNSGPGAITGTASACVGATSTLSCTPTGGVWSSLNTAIATVNSTTGVVTGVANGTVNIRYSTGCGADTGVTFTVNGTAVNITYSSGSLTGPVCSGGTLSLNSGTTSGGTYSWTGPNGFTSTAQNPTISSALTAASGTYTFTATVGGCTSPTNYKFVAVDTLVNTTTSVTPATICAGGNDTLSVSVTSPSSSNYVVNAINYAVPTMTSPTAASTGDDVTTSVALPFSFNFYGTNYSSIFLCTNGFVNFGTSSTVYPSAAIPATSGPPSAIFLNWGDRWFGAPGSITYSTEGSAPNRRFVVKFSQGSNCCSYSDLFTGYVILYETSNVADVMVTYANTNGTNGVMGIQDAARTSAVVVPGRNSVAYNVTTPEGWRFSKPNYSYTWSPATSLSATTGSTVVATALTSSTTYSVTTVDANSGCTTGRTSAVNVTVNPAPTAYSVTGGGQYCTVPGTGVAVGLSGSETGVNYQLYVGSTPAGSPVSGTGSAISFGNQTDTSAAYTVIATRVLTGCTANMTGSATVTRRNTPTTYNLTGGNGCAPAGVALGLSNSESLVNYQLWRSGGTVGSPVAGTGSAVSFGTQTVVGTYSVIATHAIGGCTATMNDSSVINSGPAAFNVTGGNACSETGVTVGLDGSASGISYQLYRGASTVGSPISGSGGALTYGSYTTPGVYSVVGIGTGGCTTNMNGTDTVLQTPSISMGSSPSVCQPISSTSISYSSPVGSPTTYNITWDATAISAGFTNASGATLPATSIPITIPSGATGLFTASVTVSNGYCTSTTYSISITVYAHPDAAVTAIDVPCRGYAGSFELTGTVGAIVDYTVDSGSTLSTTLTSGTSTISTGAITGSHLYTIINAHNPVCSTTVDSVFTITPTPMQWVGGATGAEHIWNEPTNWSCGFVPTSSDSVTIPASVTYLPIIDSAATYTVAGLAIDSLANITIENTGSLSVLGNMTNNYSVEGAGTLILNGSTMQYIAGNGSVRQLELNNTAGATISPAARMTIVKELTITDGTLNTNDSLVLYSDSSLTARVAPITPGAINGKAKVMQYIKGGRRAYRFYAHPFSTYIPLEQLSSGIDITGNGGAVNGFTTTGSNAPSVFRYDPLTSNSLMASDPGWKAFTSALPTADSNRFQRYQGIRLFMRGARGEGLSYATGYTPSPTTITTTGVLNQGPQTVILQKGTAANQDFNMVGNPYPSTIDMGTVAYNAKVSGNIVGTAFYVWNPYIATAGNFQAVLIYTASPTPYYLQANTSVQVRAAHNNDTLNFTESHKTANAPTTIGGVLKPNPDFVSLAIYDAHYHPFDMLSIKFDANATEAEDNDYDAAKPAGPDFNFYSLSADNTQLIVDGRPYAQGKVIPLGIKSNYQQEFIIKADNIALPENGKLYLHDKLLSKYVLLQRGTEYRFTVTKDGASQGEKRFELTMEGGVANGGGLQVVMTPNPANEDVNINFASGNMGNVAVRIFDMNGTTVYSNQLGNLQSGSIKVPVRSLAAGLYMVEISQNKDKVVQRLIKE